MNSQYDLTNPTAVYKLPKKYMEISGIWPLPDNNALVFVQDEAIQVYQFDLASTEIVAYTKHGSGDSEDIVILENIAYILHAGDHPAIYKITDYNTKSSQSQCYSLHLDKAFDPEGLCFDAKNNRLLIACKGSPVKGDKLRQIFSFDLVSMQRDDSPVLTLDCREFLDKPEETFNPSGIAIHPLSKDLYLVGTKSVKMMICYGMNGVFKGAWRLDENEFYQPEGIAFTKSGELFITSEGKKNKKDKKEKKARIFQFAVQNN